MKTERESLESEKLSPVVDGGRAAQRTGPAKQWAATGGGRETLGERDLKLSIVEGFIAVWKYSKFLYFIYFLEKK